MLAPGVRTAALSIPRGNGKSTLVASLAARTLRPDDPLHVARVENHIVAASIGQARRTVFKLLREQLDDDETTYKFAESHTSCHVFHRKTKARVSVLASGAAHAQGLVRCRWIWADEPGSWAAAGGANMWDAVKFAQGKPGVSLRAVLIGTLAPAADGWWIDLVNKGSRRSTRVHVLRGDAKRWDQWQNIRQCNPLMSLYPESRATMLEERDDAHGDPRLRAAFQSYRLNVPSLDETSVLLTVGDWELATARRSYRRAVLRAGNGAAVDTCGRFAPCSADGRLAGPDPETDHRGRSDGGRCEPGRGGDGGGRGAAHGVAVAGRSGVPGGGSDFGRSGDGGCAAGACGAGE